MQSFCLFDPLPYYPWVKQVRDKDLGTVEKIFPNSKAELFSLWSRSFVVFLGLTCFPVEVTRTNKSKQFSQ